MSLLLFGEPRNDTLALHFKGLRSVDGDALVDAMIACRRFEIRQLTRQNLQFLV